MTAAAPEPPHPPKPAVQFQSMKDAPHDGRPVFLLPQGSDNAVECFWRTSRRWDSRGRKWEPFGYWSRVVGPYVMIDFTPVGWLRPKQEAVDA